MQTNNENLNSYAYELEKKNEKWEKFWKAFCYWLILAEKKIKKNERFEHNYPKIVNCIRITIFFVLILGNKHIFNFFTSFWLWKIHGLIIGFIAVRFLTTWLSETWNFLVKGRILSLLVIVAILVFTFVGLEFYPFYEAKKILAPEPTNTDLIRAQAIQSQLILLSLKAFPFHVPEREIYDLKELLTTPPPPKSPEIPQKVTDPTTDKLTSFYSTLFAIVGLLIAVAGLGAWRVVKEARDKLEQFGKYEEKVNRLAQKRELAQWVQDEFDDDNDKRCLSNMKLEVDKEKRNLVEEIILKEATDDSWLKVIYAKMLIDKIGDEYATQTPELEATYQRAEKILEYLGNRDLFEESSVIENRVYHLQGQLHHAWYKLKKNDYTSNKSDIDWHKWWGIEKNKQLIKKSVMKYKEALSVIERKNQASDETLGNLAVVSIEYNKFIDYNNLLTEELDDIYKKLEKANEKDYNTFWDRARIAYYQNGCKTKKPFKENDFWPDLYKAAQMINSYNDYNFFIGRMEDELNEKLWGSNERNGFPGNNGIIKEMRNILDNKNLVG